MHSNGTRPSRMNNSWARAMSSAMDRVSSEDSWILHLATNCLTYASLIIPGYLLIRFVRLNYPTEDVAISRKGFLGRLLYLFAVGRPNYNQQLAVNDQMEQGLISQSELQKQKITVQRSRKEVPRTCLLGVFFAGLLISYVSWGWLQEALMTHEYRRLDGTGRDRFRDAQFLVFLNRFAAFMLSSVYIVINLTSQPVHTAPFYKYSFASFSNMMSSWCQYEALKYVTFPTQTICKASKIIPVMIMGKLVSGTKYPWHQYGTATLLAAGVSLFLLYSDTTSAHTKPGSSVQTTTISGVLLMTGYLAFDSFTPNWQAQLYKHEPRVSSFQMMCGVSAFSSLLTLASLLEQGHLSSALTFLFSHERFWLDCLLLSCFGAIGQIFIYKTIDHFGPVVFTIIMTIRMMVSIVLSCIYYGHAISPPGILGLLLAFTALFLNNYFKQKQQKSKPTATISAA